MVGAAGRIHPVGGAVTLVVSLTTATKAALEAVRGAAERAGGAA